MAIQIQADRISEIIHSQIQGFEGNLLCRNERKFITPS